MVLIDFVGNRIVLTSLVHLSTVINHMIDLTVT
jgi:hypothetical protein